MDIIQRLIGVWLLPAILHAFFGVLLTVMPNEANADEYPAKIQWRPPYSLPLVDTKEQSCQAVADFQSKPMLRCFYHASNGFNSVYVDMGTQPHEVAITAGQRILSCPAGGSLFAASSEFPQCVGAPACVAPKVRQPDGSCVEPPKCTPGCNGVCGTEQPFTARGTLACFSGCYYGLGDAFGLVISNDNNGKPVKTWWTDVEDNTGVPCDAPPDEQPDGADDEPPKAETPDPCPECECAKKRQTWGEVNGSIVCVKPGTPGGKPVDIAPKPTVKTETPAPTPENPNPSPTTTVTPSPVITIGAGGGGSGGGTVTETKTNPDGSKESKTQDMGSFCSENPNSPICKEADKGSFNGSCDGGFTCDGDASTCATAKVMHQNRCDMQREDATSELGKSILDGSDEGTGAGATGTWDNPLEMSVGQIDTTATLSKTCPTDIVYTIAGQAITLPISNLCDGLQIAGKIVLAFTALLCLRIIFS